MQGYTVTQTAPPGWDDRWVLTALDMNGIGAWSWDFITNISERTLAHDRIFGYDTALDTWTYETFFAHVVPEDIDWVGALIKGRIAEKSPYDFHCRIRRTDGEIRWLFCTGAPFPDDRGDIQRYIGTLKDVTDYKLIEEKLSESKRLESLGHLTAGVNHYFNNLLAVMMVNVGMVQDMKGLPAGAPRLLENTMRAIRRSADLTHQLLAFARKWALAPRPINLCEEVKKTVLNLREEWPTTVHLDLVIETPPIPAYVDTQQLKIAMENIIGNARDAMDNNGKISITVGKESRDISESEAPQDYGVVTIQDTGHGMSKDVSTKAFEPFFTTKDMGQGMGLGLSMVHGFMAQSHGLTELTSAEGEGTTIRLLFPIPTELATDAEKVAL